MSSVVRLRDYAQPLPRGPSRVRIPRKRGEVSFAVPSITTVDGVSFPAVDETLQGQDGEARGKSTIKERHLRARAIGVHDTPKKTAMER